MTIAADGGQELPSGESPVDSRLESGAGVSTISPSIAPAGTDPRTAVMAAIRRASAVTGADFDYLVRTAQRESNFDPTAKASTSTATGLFQFTESTWLRMVDCYGARHGLEAQAKQVKVDDNGVVRVSQADREAILALRDDPDLSARMAGELARENAGILEKKIGRKPTSAELYSAHFMGPTDAARMIRAARRNEGGVASRMFPAAALANEHVFETRDGKALSVADLYERLTGVKVAAADTGKIPPAILGEPSTAEQAQFASIQALGQMTSSLMTALFEVQEKRDG